MNIVVVGAGYVGLSNSVLLAQHNHVTTVDINETKVNQINNKIPPLEDKELIDYFNNRSLNLKATTMPSNEYAQADYVIISTPTNYEEQKNFFDTSSVESIIAQVMSINKNAYIIIKSTVPVGFTVDINKKYNTNKILFSPEFLREGKALYDNLYPSRIIIGTVGNDIHTLQAAKKFAALLCQGAVKENIDTLIMQATEAEAVKLFSNTFLALRVSFFNELDTYAESRGLNTLNIIDGVCLDSRIGNYYNNPSFGYGGYCLPKDTKQLLANFDNVPNNIIRAIVDANKTRKDFIASRILSMVKNITKPIIGIYKLEMKLNSDNFRKSAIQSVIHRLENANATIIIYEPSIKTSLFDGYEIVNDLKDFKSRSNVIVANRYSADLSDVASKLYTRDLYKRD